MASNRAAEERFLVALSDLHDYLWSGAHYDESELLARLRLGARDLDHRIGARGRVERAVRPMLRRFRKVSEGADLFTFLHAVGHLAFASDRVRRKPKEAAKAGSRTAVSLSIHLASAAGRRDLTEAFETGATDFATYTSKLADALEERGVLRAGEFRRATNQAFDLHALWDGRASPETKRIMAAAGVTSAGLACVLFVDALRALGRYREWPYAQLVPIVATVLRWGGHP